MPIITWIDGYKGGNKPRYAVMEQGPEWIFSHQSPVKHKLRQEATSVTVRARALLAVAQARYPGVSTWITMEGPHSGAELDYRVHLWSANGSRGAHAIEYGHTGNGSTDPRIARFQVAGKRYEGQFILHRAAGGNLRKQVRRK